MREAVCVMNRSFFGLLVVISGRFPSPRFFSEVPGGPFLQQPTASCEEATPRIGGGQGSKAVSPHHPVNTRSLFSTSVKGDASSRSSISTTFCFLQDGETREAFPDDAWP